MALVYLVRHGQASFGRQDYDQLSELGRQQSRWLGQWFADHGIRFRRAISGTLVRQRDTALGILESCGLDNDLLHTDPGLNEYPGESIWAAHTGGSDPVLQQRSDYKAYWRTFRDAMHAWADDRLENVPETWDAFGGRVGRSLSDAVQGASREESVLVVSSGGVIGRTIAHIVGGPPDTAIELNLQFRNTGFCELIAGGGTLRMLSFNAIPHLMRPDRRDAITFA
jgi:broad specificity phosphatase PhoE